MGLKDFYHNVVKRAYEAVDGVVTSLLAGVSSAFMAVLGNNNPISNTLNYVNNYKREGVLCAGAGAFFFPALIPIGGLYTALALFYGGVGSYEKNKAIQAAQQAEAAKQAGAKPAAGEGGLEKKVK